LASQIVSSSLFTKSALDRRILESAQVHTNVSRGGYSEWLPTESHFATLYIDTNDYN